jgi:hypothetical protein
MFINTCPHTSRTFKSSDQINLGSKAVVIPELHQRPITSSIMCVPENFL